MPRRGAGGRFVKGGGSRSGRAKSGVDLRGLEALKDALSEGGDRVRVGWLSAKGASEQAEIAMVHEYGSPQQGIPERAPVRTMMEGPARKDFERFAAQLSRQIVEGRLTKDRALELLGMWGTGELKKTIAAGPPLPPPLAKATIKSKGSTRPLVDKGQLVGAVSFEVSK